MEHRWGERMELDCPALLLLPDGTSVTGRLRNASISGALIETELRPAPFAMLNIALSAGNAGRRRTLELPACVARLAHDSIAVEWRDMAPPTLIALLSEVRGNEATWRMRGHSHD